MYYADLKINEISKSNGYWCVCLNPKTEGNFVFPVADSTVLEEELSAKGIVVGKSVLAAIEDDRVVGIYGF